MLRNPKRIFKLTERSLRRSYSGLSGNISESLKSIFGSNFSLADAVREHHCTDESFHQGELPDAVVFPERVEQISKVLALCNRNGIPVIPFGAGSGLEGGIVPMKGGITIDVSKFMTKVLAVNAEDFDCQVEAGVTREQLNRHIKDTGLW